MRTARTGHPGGARARLLLVAWIGLLPACAGEPATGPVEPAWDRQTCERCRMTVSSRRFAAQLRTSRDGRVQHFDDIGCALLWLDEHDGADRHASEFFVRDLAGDRWLPAAEAGFRPGLLSPMGYGFGAVAAKDPGDLDLEQVRARVREKEDGRRPR